MPLIMRLLADHTFFRDYLGRLHEDAHLLPAEQKVPTSHQLTTDFSFRLRRHARIESEILFPALQRAGTDDHRIKTVETFLLHGKDEHASVAKRQAAFNAAREKDLPDDNWRPHFDRFAEGLERHMRMEEDNIFPLAQALLSRDILTKLNQKADAIP